MSPTKVRRKKKTHFSPSFPPNKQSPNKKEGPSQVGRIFKHQLIN